MTKNDERINNLFEDLVPGSGKADNLAGELVRAMARIGYRNFNDGDHNGVDYGKETCNPAARFLRSKGNKEIRELVDAIWGIENDTAYDAVLEKLTGGDPDEDVDDWEDEDDEEAWGEEDGDEDEDEDGYWG